MKRFCSLCMVLWLLLPMACPISAYSQEAAKKKVAILEPVDKEGKVSFGIKLVVKSSLAAAIRATQRYEPLTRDFKDIMDEYSFQESGLVKDGDKKKLGDALGASLILRVEVAMYDSKNVALTAWIIDLEGSMDAIAEPVITGMEKDDMEENCRKLAGKLLGTGDAYGSAGGNRRTEYGGFGNYGTRGGQDYVENTWGLNMKMVWVEGGSFVMGCTGEQGSDCDDDEKNTRRVNLTGYYIGMTEVTQGQWQRVMGTSVEQQRNKANPSWPLRGTGTDYPMYYVSWEEAMAFCEELSRQTGRKYTLPTEAQWEYAARGGNKNDGTKYSGSYSIDAVTWYSGNSGNGTHMVGSKRPNGLGLYDMSGNVWEWCKDWYADSYIGYQTDNPTGPSSGSYRVLRGGGWYSDARYCRVSDRDFSSPGCRHILLGFRVVCVP